MMEYAKLPNLRHLFAAWVGLRPFTWTHDMRLQLAWLHCAFVALVRHSRNSAGAAGGLCVGMPPVETAASVIHTQALFTHRHPGLVVCARAVQLPYLLGINAAYCITAMYQHMPSYAAA